MHTCHVKYHSHLISWLGSTTTLFETGNLCLEVDISFFHSTVLIDAENEDSNELQEQDLLSENDGFTKSDVKMESNTASETITSDVRHNEL